MDRLEAPVPPAGVTYHRGDLRDSLLEMSLRLAAEHGPEGFSLREAARGVVCHPWRSLAFEVERPEACWRAPSSE